MEKEDKHLDGSGLGRVWAKIKAQYLAKTGGTLTGDLVLANTKRIGWVNSGGTTVSNLLQYTSDNKLYLGYGQSTVNDTNIYGKVVNIMTNGNTTRLGIDSSGNTTLSGQLTVSGGVTRFGSTTQCDIYLKRDTIASGTPTNYIHYPTNAQLQFDKYVEGSSTAQAAVMTLGADGNVYCHNAIYEGGTLISTKYTYTAGSSIDITKNVVKVSMTATSDPTASGSTISFIDSISQDTAGKITVTKKDVQAASTSASGVVTTGAQTFAGNKTFSNTGEQQVILKYNGSGNSHIGLGFANSDGLKSEIYVNANNNDAPYYMKSGGTAYEMYHAGNVNISTKSWVCNNLTFYGMLQPNGNNTQDIGGQNNVVNYIYVNRIVTPGGNGIQFGANNGDFRFYGSRLSFTDTYKLFTIKKAGGVQVHKGSLEVENGNIMASGGVAAGGIADLTIY